MIPGTAGRAGRRTCERHGKSALLQGKADRGNAGKTAWWQTSGPRAGRPPACPGGVRGPEPLPSPDERERVSALLARLPHSMAMPVN
ncbi:hypothetical protein GCM10027161_22910 [Microbispora hainanensis]